MKRDLDLVRKILISIEQKPNLEPEEITIDGYEFQIVAFHLLILKEAGLVDAVMSEDASGELVGAFAIRLTWDGFEFLELARNDTVWQKSKKFLKDKTVSVSVAILTEILKAIVRDTLGLGGIQSLPQQPV
jgi:DNA-binding transcriptional ArsR family regulator